MATEYTPYQMHHVGFENQHISTYHSWPGSPFDSSEESGIIQPPPFTSSLHRSETSSPPSNTHFALTQGAAFHSPHGGNQPIVYPESSQRTLMDDTPYLPEYEVPSRPADTPPQAAVLSGGPDPARLPRMSIDEATRHLIGPSDRYSHNAGRDTFPSRHQQNTSEPSLAPHQYSVVAQSPQAPPHSHDLPLTPRAMNNMMAEFSLSFIPPATPSPLASPISPYPDRTALRPSMLTLQMGSLEVVDDPGNHATLSSLMESSGNMSDNTHGRVFSPVTESSSPTSETRNLRAPYSQDSTYIGRYNHVSQSESSLSSPSSSTPESESPPSYSSFPNGVGAHGRTSTSATTARGTSRKNKMHRCGLCQKLFPRPSGLATHMNSHNGAKPYKCTVSGCPKAFAVRSNAKRHLRTHGVTTLPSNPHAVTPPFTVGFEVPLISHNHGSGETLPKLKWVQQDLTTRVAMEWLDSPSPSGSDDADGGPGPASPMSAVFHSGYLFGHEQGYAETPRPYHSNHAGPSSD
jgi:hypothetical protein